MYRARYGRRPGSNMLYLLALHAASQFLQLPQKPPVTAGLILANTLVYLRPGRLNDILPLVEDVCLSPKLVIQGAKAVWDQVLSYFRRGGARPHVYASPLLKLHKPLCHLLRFYLHPWFIIDCDERIRKFYDVGEGKDLRRLFLSSFYHLSDSHLVYNMISLLWKGVHLERMYGSRKFATMVAVLLGLSHGLVVVTAKLLESVAKIDGPMYECAVGFSSILFALKVVLNYNSPTCTSVYGILMPSRYAAWAELVLAQLLVPDASFFGHFCGILAGLIYVHASEALRPGYPSGGFWRPASWLLSVLMWPFKWIRLPFRRRQGSIHGHGFLGSRRATRQQALVWNCSVCTFLNSEHTPVCEMCGYERVVESEDLGNGMASADSRPSAPPWPASLSVEELRQARIARFTR